MDVSLAGLLALYASAFTAGVGASLTPCVYPMIPIVLGIFGARGKDVSRARSFALATLYVFGMGTTYGVLGALFASLGGEFSALLSRPEVVIPLVAIYAALAASMFGAFDLNLPASWQTRLSQVGGSGYRGAFAMGLVGGFTAAPCTGPFVAGILAAVAKNGDVVVGASVLFVHALGIGVLYWVLAAFANALPKSGRWMEWVKSIGGSGLLIAALYFLRPIVPALRNLATPDRSFLIVCVAVAIAGIALGAIHLSFHADRKTQARKALAVLLLVAGSYGAIAWALTPSRRLPWGHDEAAAFIQARASHRGVMVDFSARWCTPCEELELTFAENGVYETIVGSFVPLKFDVSADTDQDSERRERYRALTLPSVLFLDADGAVLGRVDQSTADYLTAGGFRKVLDPATAAVTKGTPP
jgi:thiol:disulfide interchange protein DsbD